jgi:hypothetical protein
MEIERIPSNYQTFETPVEDASEAVIANEEFSQFILGQKETVSDATKKQVARAFSRSGDKLKLFFGAYRQKNMGRLAKLMQVLGSVEDNLFQDFRINTMSNEDLIDLFGELGAEKSRVLKEIVDMSTTLQLDDPQRVLEPEAVVEDDGTKELSKSSKKNIISFFKQKVVGAE